MDYNPTYQFNDEAEISWRPWMDLSGIQFSEEDTARTIWLQALPLGTYDHPVHGEIKITPERIKRFADNINNKVRGQDLDIDYDHKAIDTKAAGWVQAAEDRGTQGLWIQVEFTESAWKALKAHEFRYFSPEFVDAWTHPKSGQKFSDVMFGGALTNRPFLKDILPINLNELINPVVIPTKKGPAMDPNRLRAMLQLSEDATDEEVETALEDVLTTPEASTDEVITEEAAEPVTTDPIVAQLSETERSNPTIALLLAEREETSKRMASLEASQRLSETQAAFASMSTNGKFAVPPAVLSEAVPLIASLPKGQADKFIKMFSELTKTGVVALGEMGHQTQLTENSAADDAADFLAKVSTHAEKHNVSLSEASMAIAASDPDGFAAYRQATTNRN